MALPPKKKARKEITGIVTDWESHHKTTLSAATSLASINTDEDSMVGNVTGYPGVFLGNLHPYPSKPVPASTGAGFDKYRCWFCKNPRGYNPSTGAPSNTDRENIS